jgi:phosphoserine phosphatase
MMLYLVRHAETEWNRDKRLQGWGDGALTEKGCAQAAALGVVLKEIPFAKIHCSSSGRTRHTLAIALPDRSDEARYSDELREIALGTWEGQYQKDIEASEPENFYAFWNDPANYAPRGGETFAAVADRVGTALRSLAAGAGGDALVISHTVAIRMMLIHVLGENPATVWDRPYMQPCSITRLSYHDGVFSLEDYAAAEHLNGL